MKITLKRDQFREDCTLGQLFIDGIFECYTLEPPVRKDKPRAIPLGTYKLEMYNSPSNKRKVPLLLNVPGFDMVEIHIGNFPKNSKACVLTGKDRGSNYLLDSRLAFDALMKKVQPAIERGEATLEIT